MAQFFRYKPNENDPSLFSIIPRFFSQLYAAAEDVKHGMLVFLPVASVQQITMQEQFQLISGNSAVTHTNTGVNIQEITWVLERQTGLPVLIQVIIRYRLYRHLMNEVLPLNKSEVSQSF